MPRAQEVAKDLQGVAATRLAKQTPASVSRQKFCAIQDAMEDLQTPNALTTVRFEIQYKYNILCHRDYNRLLKV